MTLKELISNIKTEMGERAVLDLDRDIATVAKCSCGNSKEIYAPVHKLRGADILCPHCGNSMSFDTIHSIDGSEDFLDKTAFEIGIPLLHIVAGRCGYEMRYFEFTSDTDEVFEGL